MEDDDTEVLTQEEKNKIQNELIEQQKQDDEQEEDWVKSYPLAAVLLQVIKN